jgi:amidohydrolase
MSATSLLASEVLRSRLAAEIESVASEVERLARVLHANPELAYHEVHAAAILSEFLESRGFEVERRTGGLETAFTASAGSGDLVVAICAEYDGLPGVGHACGHHLIAGVAIAAAAALRSHCDDLGIRLIVVGTPAEETGGGKVDLLEADVFDDVDLAAMVHFASDGLSVDPRGSSSQVVGRFRAVFGGRGAHAAGAPHLGINAGDAALVAQVALGLLRQQMPSDHRASAITVEAGVATNIIPSRAVVDFECRAWIMPEYLVLFERVVRCFEGAATATGTTLELSATQHVLDALRHDEGLAARWTAAMVDLGYDTDGAPFPGGSTDMGNVSQFVPSIHPMVSLPGVTWSTHTPEFAEAADTPAAYRAMRDSALALARAIAATAESVDERSRLRALRLARPPYRGSAQAQSLDPRHRWERTP